MCTFYKLLCWIKYGINIYMYIWIQYILYILYLFLFHLRLFPPSGVFPSGFLNKISFASLISSSIRNCVIRIILCHREWQMKSLDLFLCEVFPPQNSHYWGQNRRSESIDRSCQVSSGELGARRETAARRWRLLTISWATACYSNTYWQLEYYFKYFKMGRSAHECSPYLLWIPIRFYNKIRFSDWKGKA